eukprot:gene5393-70_t
MRPAVTQAKLRKAAPGPTRRGRWRGGEIPRAARPAAIKAGHLLPSGQTIGVAGLSVERVLCAASGVSPAESVGRLAPAVAHAGGSPGGLGRSAEVSALACGPAVPIDGPGEE